MIVINYNHKKSSIEIEKNGKKIKSVLDTNDLLVNIMGNINIFNYPLLPRGTKFVKERADKIIIGIEFGKRRQALKYLDYGYNTKPITFSDVGFPAGLFICIIDKINLSLRESYLFAVKKGGIDINTPLYTYPFPNIYESGRVCWGDTLTSLKPSSIMFVEGLLEIFFSSIFNTDLNDLYDEELLSPNFMKSFKFNKRSYINPIEIYEKIEGKDFKDEWLSKHPVYENINKLLKEIYREDI